MHADKRSGVHVHGRAGRPDGLQYLRARYYDAATGASRRGDPLPLLQRYAYAGGNPANLADPMGLDDNKPEAIPLPAAGSGDLLKRFSDGWLECIMNIAREEQLLRQNDTERYYRAIGPYNDVCTAYRRRCEHQAYAGDPNTKFDKDGARADMKKMSGRLADVGHEISLRERVGNAVRSLALPFTGSAGLLSRPDKEGGFSGFGCAPLR